MLAATARVRNKILLLRRVIQIPLMAKRAIAIINQQAIALPLQGMQRGGKLIGCFAAQQAYIVRIDGVAGEIIRPGIANIKL